MYRGPGMSGASVCAERVASEARLERSVAGKAIMFEAIEVVLPMCVGLFSSPV
jgi:hypothetical protein